MRDVAGADAAGSVPRWAVHCALLIMAVRMAGLEEAPDKTQGGRSVTALGIQVDVDSWSLHCPEPKRQTMLASIRQLTEEARSNQIAIIRTAAASLVGRLSNLTQVAPEITESLCGGFAVSSASWLTKAGCRVHPPVVRLAAGGARAKAWILMLETAEAAFSANSCVSLAPTASFTSRHAAGSLTLVTDASGEDGFGGYGFLPEAPGVVFLVSREWPEAPRRALANAARPAAERSPSEGLLSMPAAEAFAAMAVCAAIGAVARVSAVYAIGDCEPVAYAINAAASPVSQMNSIIKLGRRTSTRWLGVHVPRELNLDADRLSHPQELQSVARDALAAGIRPVVLEPPRHVWQVLQGTLHPEGAPPQDQLPPPSPPASPGAFDGLSKPHLLAVAFKVIKAKQDDAAVLRALHLAYDAQTLLRTSAVDMRRAIKAMNKGRRSASAAASQWQESFKQDGYVARAATILLNLQAPRPASMERDHAPPGSAVGQGAQATRTLAPLPTPLAPSSSLGPTSAHDPPSLAPQIPSMSRG